MRSRAYLGMAVLAVILTATAPGEAQSEQWLQYRSAREASQIAGGLSTRQLTMTDSQPVGVALPEFKSDSPVFAQWSTPMVESGTLWIALDRTTSSSSPNILYIDSNGDGRLDDETGQAAYRMDQYYSYFGPVKVIFQIPDGPVTYHLNLRVYTRDSSNRRMYISAGGWYEGDVTVGGQKKHCVLLDYNANGTFNDRSPQPGECDRIRISERNTLDALFVGKYLQIDGTLYAPEIARDGAFVKLPRAEGVKYGTVKLAENITALSAGGENGQFILKPENGIAKLPVGTYGITEWAVERKDDRGIQWKLQGQGTGAPETNAFTVSETEEAALEIGEPIQAALEAREREGTYSFSQGLRGRHGERIALTRNGARPQAPRLNIRNKDGTYDRTFSFAYG